jgi:hypothetical protein
MAVIQEKFVLLFEQFCRLLSITDHPCLARKCQSIANYAQHAVSQPFLLGERRMGSRYASLSGVFLRLSR